MKRLKEVLIVEGRYDKNALSQVVDAVIIETGGFAVFNDKEKQKLLRRLARERGLVILTDPDGAGFQIRGFLKGIVEQDRVKQAYVPDIRGKERRKAKASREGKLGVEGMSPQILMEALIRSGASFEDEETPPLPERRITKADLYARGLLGRENSREARLELIRRLDLPERLSSDALLDLLNALMDRDRFIDLFREDPPHRAEE